MKFAIASAVSLLSLTAPIWATELEERHQNVLTKTIHDLSVSTTTTTVFATVTLGAGQAQIQDVTHATQTAAPQVTHGRGSHHRVIIKPVTVDVTKTVAVTRNQVVTHTVTENHVRTKTDRGATVTQTQVVEHTVVSTATEDFTTTVLQAVTTTVTSDVIETDAATQTDGQVADANSNVDTETVVDTSTFLVTTVVDGSTVVETSTASDAVGTIADDSNSTGTDDNATATATDSAGDPNSTDDSQTSLNLDPRLVQPGLALTGQETPTPGQVASLTSTNNFINFCLTQNVPLTDGQQIRAGSCNVVPMGLIIAKDKLPSAKFVFPLNFGTVTANQPFTVKLKLNNLQAGAFTNAQTNYYAAPATVNDQGIVIGHSHVVIEKLPSLDSTEPLDPTQFTFFKGLNDPLDGDSTLSTTLAQGLAAGFYRLFSINTASNHQPCLASVAQHGSMDDGIYFTVA